MKKHNEVEELSKFLSLIDGDKKVTKLVLSDLPKWGLVTVNEITFLEVILQKASSLSADDMLKIIDFAKMFPSGKNYCKAPRKMKHAFKGLNGNLMNIVKLLLDNDLTRAAALMEVKDLLATKEAYSSFMNQEAQVVISVLRERKSFYYQCYLHLVVHRSEVLRAIAGHEREEEIKYLLFKLDQVAEVWNCPTRAIPVA